MDPGVTAAAGLAQCPWMIWCIRSGVSPVRNCLAMPACHLACYCPASPSVRCPSSPHLCDMQSALVIIKIPRILLQGTRKGLGGFLNSRGIGCCILTSRISHICFAARGTMTGHAESSMRARLLCCDSPCSVLKGGPWPEYTCASQAHYTHLYSH